MSSADDPQAATASGGRPPPRAGSAATVTPQAWSQAVLGAASGMTEQSLVQVGPAPSGLSAFPPMPWSIGTAGRKLLAGPSGSVVGVLCASGSQFVASPQGATLAAQVAAYDWRSGPNTALADQVETTGIFAGAFDTIKADQLLRSFSVGGGGGAQVLVGGQGGGGQVWDVAGSDTGGYTYGWGFLGIGGQVGGGLQLGAWSRIPAQMTGSVVALQLGVNAGAGALVTVVMDEHLELAGYAVQIGLGAGVSASVAYGSLHLA